MKTFDTESVIGQNSCTPGCAGIGRHVLSALQDLDLHTTKFLSGSTVNSGAALQCATCKRCAWNAAFRAVSMRTLPKGQPMTCAQGPPLRSWHRLHGWIAQDTAPLLQDAKSPWLMLVCSHSCRHACWQEMGNTFLPALSTSRWPRIMLVTCQSEAQTNRQTGTAHLQGHRYRILSIGGPSATASTLPQRHFTCAQELLSSCHGRHVNTARRQAHVHRTV